MHPPLRQQSAVQTLPSSEQAVPFGRSSCTHEPVWLSHQSVVQGLPPSELSDGER
jgi:hypothetical protein